jgi:hypothetical protein
MVTLNVSKILCNISEIVKLAKGENDTQLSKMTQSEQDTYEMHVRAANIVSLHWNKIRTWLPCILVELLYSNSKIVMSDCSQR